MPKPETAAPLNGAPKTPLPKTLTAALPVAGDLVKHSDAIRRLEATLREQMNAARKSGAVPLARAFVVYHRAMERVALDLKPIEALFKQFKEADLPATFEQDGVTSIPLAEGYRVGVSTTTRASIREGQRAAAYKWLRDNGLGDIIGETINSGTLSSTAKKMQEDNNRELPEQLFNVALMPNTSVTQTKS